MIALFRNRKVDLYPMGIDNDEYVVACVASPDDLQTTPPKYYGAASFLATDKREKLDAYLVRRMELRGFDIYHPKRAGNLVILKRLGPQ